MYVRIDEARHHPATLRIDRRHSFASANLTGLLNRIDDAVEHQHICEAVEVIRGIDDASATEQHRLHRAASGSFIESTIE